MSVSLQVWIKKICSTLPSCRAVWLPSSKKCGHIFILLFLENVGTDGGLNPCIKCSLLLKSVFVTSFISNKKICSTVHLDEQGGETDQIARALFFYNFLTDLYRYANLRAIHISATIICYTCKFFRPWFQRNAVSFTFKNKSFPVVLTVMVHKLSTSSWTWNWLWHRYYIL